MDISPTTPVKESTVSVLILIPLWHYARQQGVDVANVGAECGLTPEMVTKPETRVHINSIRQFWIKVADALADPTLGFKLGSRMQPHALGLLGYVLSNSDTLREAISMTSRYYRLLYDRPVYHFSVTGDFGQIVVDDTEMADDPEEDRLLIEFILCAIDSISMALSSLDGFEHANEVHFRHKAPHEEHLQALREYFRADIQFEAQDNRLVFPIKLIDTPIAYANHQMFDRFRRQADQAERVLQQDELVSDVEYQIRQRMTGRVPTIVELAEHFNVSRSTLQRRLQEKDTSFQEIADRVRKSIALELLQNGTPLVEITFFLGYSEPSAFYHAFKRWTGKTPLQFLDDVSN